MITARLKYLNEHKQTYWFVSLGDPQPTPGLFLVRRTTIHKQRAKRFENAAQAIEMMQLFNPLPLSDSGMGWSIDLEDDTITKPAA